jgi:hypothetical protein
MDRIQALRRLTLIILAIGWLPTAQSADPAAWATVKLKLAQTHVIETLPGRVWNTDKIDMELHLVGLRKTLAIVEYNEAAIPTVPRLKVSHAELAEPVIVTSTPPRWMTARPTPSQHTRWCSMRPLLRRGLRS